MFGILRKIFLPVICPSVVISFVKESLLMVLPLYVLNIGGSLVEGAMIIGLMGIGKMAAGLPAGYLLSKIGDKWIMLIAAMLFIIALLLIALFPSMPILMFSAIILGFGHSSWLVGRTSFLTDGSAIHERGRVMALTAGTNRISNVIGPFFSGIIITFSGFDAIFVIYAIISLLAILFIFIWVPFSKPSPIDSTYTSALKNVLSNNKQTFMTAGVASFVLMLVRSSRALLLPLMGGALLLNESDIGLAIAIGAIIDTLLFYPAGSLMDRIGRKPIFIFSLVTIGIGLCALPLSQGLWSLILVSSLMGIGNGVSTGIIVTVGSDLAPQYNRGNFIGVWRLLSDIGSTSGPILIGGVLKLSGLAVGAYSVGAIGLLGGVFVIMKVEETYRVRRNEKAIESM